MQIVGGIATAIGIAGLIAGCALSVRKMNKLNDLNFKQKKPAEYKKLQADIVPYIVVGVGIFAFIVGFMLLNFM